MRILIVEDEAPLRKSLGQYLRQRHHTVFEAEHGAEALAVLAGEPVELIISDIKMPVLDGIELLKAVKRDWPGIEVVLVTGFQDLETAIAATRHDAYDYLTKPYDLHEIERLVTRLAEQRELTSLLQRVREQNARAQRLASLGVLAAGLMREINRPNTRILCHAVTLHERLAPLAARPELRATIERELQLEVAELGKSVAGIIHGAEQIEAIIRRATGFRGLPTPSPTTEAVGCLASALDYFQESMAGVTLVRPDPAVVAPVAASDEELLQIFTNLLANAFAAVAGVADPTIEVGIAAVADRVVITVDDNGPGLAPDRVERVFEPVAATPADAPGRGLGLFIVYQIVENLKGAIRYERRNGEVTRFQVELPRAAA